MQQLGHFVPRECEGAFGYAVIACDKRKAFVQGSACDEAIHFFLYAEEWIASRSLSSGAHSRDPLARNDEPGRRGVLDTPHARSMTAERAVSTAPPPTRSLDPCQ